MKRSKDKNFHHIREAYSSFRKRNFTNTIIILDQLKSHGVEDQYALFLQAVSYLYSNNFPAANANIEKIQRLNPSYTPFVQLKTFLALKSAPTKEGAIAAYIQAIEKNPSDRLLRRGLKLIENSKDFQAFQRGVKITDLVNIPAPGKENSSLNRLRVYGHGMSRRGATRYNPVYIATTVLAVAVIIGGTLLLIKFWQWKNPAESTVSLDRESISKIEMVDLGGAGYGIINRINRDKTPEFYATGDEVVKDFNEAKLLIKKGYMNRAVRILNRISNSNASYPVKEKCDFLVRFIIESDERIYEEIDLKQINEKPYLFRGSAVRFTGTAANVRERNDGRSLSLMIGYDGKSFKGICEVYDKGKEPVANGDTVEVSGMLILNIGKAATPYISSEKVRILSHGKN